MLFSFQITGRVALQNGVLIADVGTVNQDGIYVNLALYPIHSGQVRNNVNRSLNNI